MNVSVKPTIRPCDAFFFFPLNIQAKIFKSNCAFFFLLLLSVSRRFSQILKRQTSLNHLCQVAVMFVVIQITAWLAAANQEGARAINGCACVGSQASRTVINNADITFQMLEDWRNVDLNSITKQTLYTMEDSQEEHRQLIVHRRSTHAR